MLLSRCIVSACLAMVFLLGGSAALNAQSVQPVGKVWYDSAKQIVHCELTNNSSLAGRAQAVEVLGGHATASLGGFPMLPHMQRILSVDWASGEPPRSVEIIFDYFRSNTRLT